MLGYLLHALNLGTSKSKKKSLLTINVLSLCQTLIKDFTENDFKLASAIINQRNEELHTGSAAFEEYPVQQWIPGLYRLCKILTEFQNESLESLLGEEIKNEAELIIAEEQGEVLSKTKSAIAAHARVFLDKDETTKQKLVEEAKKESEKLAFRGHHRVVCPSCGSQATVSGETFGGERLEHKDGKIITRVSILPTKFSCKACELKLDSYNALKVADIANHYTRRTNFAPEEYYNMISRDELEAIRERYDDFDYLDDSNFYDEYNND